MESKQFCQVCYSETELVTLPWGDAFCQSWVENWTITCITTHKLTSGDYIKCINHECPYLASYNDMVASLSAPIVNKLNEAYNEVYLSQTQDVASCPKFGWRYAGVISNQGWSAPLKCEKWYYEWTVPSQMNFLHKMDLSLRNMRLFHFETFSYINDVTFGKPCPDWGIVIFKDGGCDVMTCANCSHKFWWYCQGTHTGCKKSQSENCIIPRIFTPLMILFSLLFIVCRLRISINDSTIRTFLLCINSTAEIITTVVSMFLYLWLISVEMILICCCAYDKGEEIKESGKKIKCIMSVCALVYPFVWTYGFYTYFLYPGLQSH